MSSTISIRRGFSIISTLGIICLTTSGCATYSLHDSIQRTPRADAKRYPALGKGRYKGVVNSSGKTYDFYYIEDIIWKAPKGGPSIEVLVPAEGQEGEAIILSYHISPELLLACQGSFAKDALRQKRQWLDIPVYAFYSISENEHPSDLPFEQIPTEKVKDDYPVVLSIVMTDSKHPKSLQTVRNMNRGRSPADWEWSKPRELRECLVTPTRGQYILSHVGFLGYLVTIPVDIITSPFQLIGFVIFSLTFHIP